MENQAAQNWESQNFALRYPCDYDLYGAVLLEQPGESLVRVFLMLEETLLSFQMTDSSSTTCTQDIKDMYFKEISKMGSTKTLHGVQIRKDQTKIQFYFSNELQRLIWIEKLQEICRQKQISSKYATLKQTACREDCRVFRVKNMMSRRWETLKEFKKSVPSSCRKVEREIEILRSANHPHLIRIEQVLETSTCIKILHEYAYGGTLLDWIRRYGPLPESTALQVTSKVIKAVAHLHKQKIAHLDIRPQNVLIMAKRDLEKIKLCEFGQSEKMITPVKSKFICNTEYTAPEVIRQGVVCTKADIFSCGILLCYTLLGYNPLWAIQTNQSAPKTSLQSAIEEILSQARISEPVRDFIKHMTDKDPKQRPGACETLKATCSIQQDRQYDSVTEGDGNMLNPLSVQPTDLIMKATFPNGIIDQGQLL